MRRDPPHSDVPDASADVVVSCWTAFRGADPAELAEAGRVLRPGGRLLAVHDYGRDDVSRLLGRAAGVRDAGAVATVRSSSGGFKIRVVHCFWTFESIEDGRDFLDDGASGSADGGRGRHDAAAALLQRRRLPPDVRGPNGA